MVKTAGIHQLLTVLALVIAAVGMVLTYNGVDDLRVVTVTVFSVAWLSLAMLIYYRRSTTERVRARQRASTGCPTSRPRRRKMRRVHGIR